MLINKISSNPQKPLKHHLFNRPGFSHTYPRHISARQRKDASVEVIVERFRTLLEYILVSFHDVVKTLSVATAVTKQLVVLPDFSLRNVNSLTAFLQKLPIFLLRSVRLIKELALLATRQVATPIADKRRPFQFRTHVLLVRRTIRTAFDDLALAAPPRTIPRRILADILPEATLLSGAVVLLLPPVRFVFLAMFPKLPHNR